MEGLRVSRCTFSGAVDFSCGGHNDNGMASKKVKVKEEVNEKGRRRRQKERERESKIAENGWENERR